MTNVSIEQGMIAGAESDGVYRFLGLPYAAPPVGDRRWRPPARPESWASVRDATEFGNAAVQTLGTGLTGIDLRAEESEDCLYLNVWTPTLDSAAAQPVMVWIHGGGFLFGAASQDDRYDGAKLAGQGVTVVTLNYRLGAFGFLAHPEMGANFAVLDWVAALSWVAANIASFGGDGNNVTIFGQSAGGAAVRILLSTPAARGLFHRAVIQSAGFEYYAGVPSPSYQRTVRASEQVCDHLGSRDANVLRGIDTEKIREASLAFASISPPSGQVPTPANHSWYPVAEDDVVFEHDFLGWAPEVPVMLGCVQHEARTFITPTGVHAAPTMKPSETYTLETLEHMAMALGGDAHADILAFFADSGAAPYDALEELYSAAIWYEPALATLERFADLGRRTYYYHFARVAPGARGPEPSVRLGHGAEVPYIFGNLTPADAYDQVDTAVSKAVQHAWIEFARTGVPRGRDGSRLPQYDSAAPRLTVITDAVEASPLTVDTVTQMIHALRTRAAVDVPPASAQVADAQP